MGAVAPFLAVALASLVVVLACARWLPLLPRLRGSIRESIDSLPEGVCLCRPGGSPILVNKKMNEVVAHLTGHVVLNAVTLWSELSGISDRSGAVLDGDHLGTWSPGEDTLALHLPDGSVWQFMRRVLEGAPRYLQIEAFDISKLYEYVKDLSEANALLREQGARQRALLSNIAGINREKELLSFKMRAHNGLGSCLLMTQHLRSAAGSSQDRAALVDAWRGVISGLTTAPRSDVRGIDPSRDELDMVADMVGCGIEYHGEPPSEPRAAALFLAAVREALTNAVRHAGATAVAVRTTKRDGRYHVEISDNGSAEAHAPEPVREGVGLGSLRRRFEQEGATFEARSSGGVTLVMDIPADDCGEANGTTDVEGVRTW